MSNVVKDTVVEEYDRVKLLSRDAARSRAYLYPIKGILYFVAHRSLWKPLLSKLAPTIILTVGITAFMFLTAYVPQAAVLTLFNGPFAIASTVLLTLSESSTLSNVLSRTFLLEEAILDTFDGTLVTKNKTNIVSEGRQIRSGMTDPIAKLGKLVKKPFERFTPKAIIRYVIYLPLNFIPIVGTIIFIVLQGRRTGPSAHARYFQLKEWTKSERNEWIHQHKAAYTSFGVVAVLLELVPIASIFFSFTNTVGAALWAVDIENGTTTAPELREQASKAQ